MLVSPELEVVIADAFSDARAHFGDIGLDRGSYTERIAGILTKYLAPSPEGEVAAGFVKRLHCRDLFLATACAREAAGASGFNVTRAYSPTAWAVFAEKYKTFIAKFARLSLPHNYSSQDLADDLLGDLFLPASSGISRIASYDGRSSLGTWLRVVLANRAINTHRSSWQSQQVEHEEYPEPTAPINIDKVIRAKRYGALLADSLSQACGRLTSTERLLLLWRYHDSLQLRQIAQLLGVHQSNVTRRLRRVCRKLRDHVVGILSSQCELTDAAILECFEDILENPHYQFSVVNCIAARNQDKPHMKSISEIIREAREEMDFVQTHEVEIIRHCIEKTAGNEKKRAQSAECPAVQPMIREVR